MQSDGQTNALGEDFSDTISPALGGPDAATARRIFLALEHRDLDDMISMLSEGNIYDDALITRLKKRKLHVKDEIARLEAELVP
jgi:hypothetical protein